MLMFLVLALPLGAAASQVASHGDGPSAGLPGMNVCEQVAFKFIDFPDIAGPTIKKAVHYCNQQKSSTCGHYQEVIERSLEREYDGRVYDAKTFCLATETYVAEMHGAARVPRVGRGTLTDFEISPTCEQTVAAAFAPHAGLSSVSMPDFWYSMCLNQDCAHFLQSRTRWCELSKAPRHSVSVCEGVRKFAADEVAVHSPTSMTPKQACELYGEYVQEMAEDVGVYLSVMHPDEEPFPVREGPAAKSAATRSAALAMVSVFASAVAAAN